MRRPGIDYEAYMRIAQQLDATTTPPTDTEITQAGRYMPELLELYANGYRRGLSTGWRSIDEYYTVRHGEFTVITGIPGHGKSAWLDNVMINLARREKWHWCVFSAENFPVSRHIAGLVEIYTQRPFLKGPNPRMSPTDLDLAVQFLNDHFHFIQPREDSYSLNRIVQLAASIADLDALVIDPWNELDHSRQADTREDQYISIALSKLRWLARAADIHIFVVAHPAKYQRVHGQPKPVITLNECKGASEWYAKADNGISIWRDEMDTTGASDVHIQKIRFREVGRAGGAVRLYYDRVTGCYSDPNQRATVEEYVERQQEFELRRTREPGDDDE